jgi:hypothetical protein
MKIKNVTRLYINPEVALRHLDTVDYTLVEDFTAGLIGFGALVTEIKQIFVQLSKAGSGNKMGLNDEMLSEILKSEEAKVNEILVKLPNKLAVAIRLELSKAGISLGAGVNLSRKHLHKIIILKIVRLFCHWAENAIQDPVETVVTLISGWLGSLVSAVFAISDTKSILTTVRSEYSELQKIIKKIRS